MTGADSNNLVENVGNNSKFSDAKKSSKSKKVDAKRRNESPMGTKADSVTVQGTNISESAIKKAIFERAHHFRTNTETLTLAAARRLLEGDLGLQKNALDPFKKFISKEMEEVLATGTVSQSSSIGSPKKISGDDQGKATDMPSSEQSTEFSDKDGIENLRGPCTEDEIQVDEDSPIMGLLTDKVDLVNAQGVDESTIKKAILERADHFRANAETLTMAGARRFLEEQLGLLKNTLDPFKKLISKQIGEIFDSTVDIATDVKKATETTDAKKSKQLKRNRSAENEDNLSSKKLKKVVKKKSEEKMDSSEGEGLSEDEGSQSSAGKAEKKKVAPAAPYSKHVEHLKSVIKACGMSVPPFVYKKAKQVSDEKRESFLTKELEDILSREGLSKNPTEKEIKEVKKRKERAKELEGIDLSNIVSSGRRRSATSFIAPNLKSEGKPEAIGSGKGGNGKAKGITKDNDVENKKKKVEKSSGADRKEDNMMKQNKEKEVEENQEERGGEDDDGEKGGEEEEEEEGEEEKEGEVEGEEEEEGEVEGEEEEEEEEEGEEEDDSESEDFEEGDSEDND